MDRYKLSPDRYNMLRDLCRNPEHEELVDAALKEMDTPGLETWIKKHVTTGRWKWKRMEAAGIPCTGDTFRIHRARFYYCLNEIIKRGEQMTAMEEYNDDS